jgi:hypothetical protein
MISDTVHLRCLRTCDKDPDPVVLGDARYLMMWNRTTAPGLRPGRRESWELSADLRAMGARVSLPVVHIYSVEEM